MIILMNHTINYLNIVQPDYIYSLIDGYNVEQKENHIILTN